MSSPITFKGICGKEALFDVEGNGVLVNTGTHSTREVDLNEALTTRLWLAASVGVPVYTWNEIASYAVDLSTPASVEVVIASSNQTRGHTVPKAVIREAQLGLARAQRLGRQTAMSLFTGRSLSTGGQVSYAKLQHVARFLNASPIADKPYRNAYDKTTWSLWGGDPARRWVNSMVGKQTLTLTSDGFLIDPSDLGAFDREDVIIFALTQEGDPFAVEGLFYVNDGDDSVNVWDAGHWTPYGDTEELDAMADRLVEVDEETAMNVAASLDEMPGELVYLSTLHPHETALAIMAEFNADARDLSLQSRVAAGGSPAYTPEERSQNAGEQPRDALGKFATVGANGVMKSGTRGTIRGVNPTNNYLLVEGEDGSVYSIPSRDFTIGKGPLPDPPLPLQPPQPGVAGPGTTPKPVPKLDLSKILAEPRALSNSPKAVLDRTLPPLNPAALRSIIEDYNKFIIDERNRNAYKFKAQREREKQVHTNSLRADAGMEPIGTPAAMTPDTSDVPPIYMAIVDRDDPKAVLDLVSLSPSTASAPNATTYRRVAGQWVRDDKVLQDLKSPTPPPVVVLNDVDLQSVLTQVDQSSPTVASGAQIFIGANNEAWEFLLAAGDNESGVGAAERLRVYWTTGKGGLKIRWGSGGDWKRCHRYLAKYLGERSKGYCAIRHHEMNGYWPGDKQNLVKGG